MKDCDAARAACSLPRSRGAANCQVRVPSKMAGVCAGPGPRARQPCLRPVAPGQHAGSSAFCPNAQSSSMTRAGQSVTLLTGCHGTPQTLPCPVQCVAAGFIPLGPPAAHTGTMPGFPDRHHEAQCLAALQCSTEWAGRPMVAHPLNAGEWCCSLPKPRGLVPRHGSNFAPLSSRDLCEPLPRILHSLAHQKLQCSRLRGCCAQYTPERPGLEYPPPSIQRISQL